MISGSLAPAPCDAVATQKGRLAFALTRRAVLLLLAGTFCLVPAFFHPRLTWGMFAWDSLILVIAVIDGFTLPAPAEIQARRTWFSAPALGNETEVEISLLLHATPSRRRPGVLQITAIDDLAPAFLQIPQPLKLKAYTNLRVAARYHFASRARGDHAAGKLFLRYSSALGLVERWAVADLRQTVRIYPNIYPGDGGLLFLTPSRQHQLEQRRQRQRGQGRDFQSLREYRDGDDLRDICWTAAARRGSLVSKQYQIEKSQPVWVVMDAGRLLQARIGGYSKLDYATTAAFALSRLALLFGDRVGLFAYGREVQQRVALGRGASHLRQIMESLALVDAEPGEADHLRAAVTLNRMQPRRSLILWLTDLAETAMRPEVVDGASLTLRRHLVLFVAVQQQELAQIAGSRPTNASQMFERAAARELVRRRELLLARLREQGALTLETTPQKLRAAVLNRYLEVKDRALL